MKVLIVRYKRTRGVPEGGEQCSERNLSLIQNVVGDTNVETYYVHDEAHRRTLWEYVQGIFYMPQGYYFGLTPKRVREIVRRANQYEAVFVDRSVFGIVAKQLKSDGYKGRVVCFFHNVETVYFAAKYSHRLNPLRWLTVACAGRNDRWCCLYADSLMALSMRDDNQIYIRYGRRADYIVPIAFTDRYRRDKYPSDTINVPPVCMFLGAYFPANIEGIEWFVREVYPHVNVRILVVGKGMDRLREAGWLPTTAEVHSDVPDLTPLFEEADLMVLPIFKGSGMKVKTCESLMYGKHIIGTPEAWSGYELDYTQAGACCQTATEFVSAIKTYCQERPSRFNAYSRQIFLERYAAECMVDKFRAVLN